eukprot:1671743-Prymnesium_polylepis.2
MHTAGDSERFQAEGGARSLTHEACGAHGGAKLIDDDGCTSVCAVINRRGVRAETRAWCQQSVRTGTVPVRRARRARWILCKL